MIQVSPAQKIVRKIFPKSEILSITPKNSGIINKNYLLKTRNPEKEFILRLYPTGAWKAEKEKFVYGLISANTDVPLPRIYLHDNSKNIIDTPCMLLSYIVGTELDNAYRKSRNLSLITNAGKYLAQIHSINLPAFGWILANGIAPSFDRWTDFLQYDFNEKLRILERVSGFPKEIIIQSRKYFEKKKKNLETNEKPCLLHKDYHFTHILADEKKINGIIDVEWAIAGSPELDVAKSCMWMFEDMHELEKPFLKGYQSQKKLSKSFYTRKPIYDFLILVSAVSLSYEYNNMKWLDKNLAKLKLILELK